MIQDLFRKTYAAFNARAIDTVLSVLHPDVDWENGMEGGRVHGHDAARAYWERRFTLIDGRVEPESIEELPDGRVSVTVHQRVRDLEGNLVSEGQVRHIYELREGLITRMDIA